MPENRDQRCPERLAAPMLPVAILGAIAIVVLAYVAIGSMMLDEERRQDGKADRRADEQRLEND